MPKVIDIDERRQELTDAAARLIARSGLGAATLRDVAAEAGLTTGALTHYFADKRELLHCTFMASLQLRRARRPDDRPDDPHAALRAALAGALPMDEDTRRHWMVTVAFCAEAAGDAELAATQRDAYRDYRSRVTRLVERCIDVSADDDLKIAEQLIAAVDGVALQALFDHESWSAARQLAALDRALELARCVRAVTSGPEPGPTPRSRGTDR
jgi:AcrR family transcriptional regulator